MARLPFPADTDAFSDETRAAVRHIQSTRGSMPPPSSYLTYAGTAGVLLSDLVEHLRYRTSLTDAEIELAICTSVRAADVDFSRLAVSSEHCSPLLSASLFVDGADISRFSPINGPQRCLNRLK